MELGLAGRPAVVTAASRGLGRAVAAGLLREGCRVVISARDASTLEATAASLRAETGGEVHAVVADVADAGDCARLMSEATERVGPLRVLVTNTGGPPAGGVLDLDDEAWRAAVDSILFSALRLSRAAVPLMRAAGGGAIIHLASITAKQPIDGLALSNALRPALVGMAKTLSREAAPEVRVATIATDHILTERSRYVAEHARALPGESVDDALARLGADVPLGRYGTPEEFANVVVFLASDAAAYVTGVTLAVDGGGDRGLF